MVKINFEETYSLDSVAKDFSFATFVSTTQDGGSSKLVVEITPLNEQFLPNVLNLAFGPLGEDGKINDHARIHHLSSDKVFSTIILFAFTFLKANPYLSLGIDGSDDIRAYLYHRMFVTNKNYLSDYFVALGVDWYVRLLRNGTIEETVEGYPFFKPKTEPFDYLRSPKDLYRYYLFQLAL